MTQISCMAVRMKVAIVFFLLLFGYVVYCLHDVQIVRHEELFAKAKEKYTAKKVQRGNRGEIFDYEGNLLVGNIPTFDIYADPSETGDAEHCAEIATFFEKMLNKDYGLQRKTIFERLMKKEIRIKDSKGEFRTVKRRYAVIAQQVEYDFAWQLRLAVEKRKFKGIYFKESFKRNYPKGSLLANILGFTNLDRDKVVAVIGLEKFFDKDMMSRKSTSVYERSRDGIPISYGNADIQEVRDGLNLYLTIREPIQSILEEELDKLMEKSGARAAYAIMADPQTGDILAVAQRPTYDPNDRSTMSPDCYRNRIAEDTMEPGSIMKPFAVAGALDQGYVTPHTRFDTNRGLWFYGGKPLRDSHPMGILNVKEIVQKSSNIGTAKIALLMGEKNLDSTLRAYGFSSRTGIPLKPETAGIFRKVKNWDTLSITRFCIGQGIAASPLQLVRAYCILANGGHPVDLRLVDRIENANNHVVEKIPVKRGKSIYQDSATHHEIISMLKTVTEEGGTAKSAAIPGYHVAGKTGTSQKFVNGQYSHKQYFASFVGFVPADNPRFVLLVTADEPKGSIYGGSVAGPSFSEIAQRTLQYLHVPYDVPLEEWENNRKQARLKAYEERRLAANREKAERERKRQQQLRRVSQR